MSDKIPSSFVKIISQFSDPYERQARLYPALLALIPPVIMILALYNNEMTLLSSILSALITCGLLFFLSDAARQLGKSKEKALWKKWGGAPSTQALRHSDETFDVVTKKRYHATLSTAMGLSLPSSLEEAAAPEKADAIYSSACNFLRNATRDTKIFSLLFKDNISYGFRRNAYGLRWLAIAISFLCVAWILIRHGVASSLIKIHDAPNLESMFSAGEGVSLVIAIIMLLVWTIYFTERTVHDAAFSYAQKLIESCETAAIKKLKSKPIVL